MLLDAIILTCSDSFNHERSTSAVYHLLNGKQSIQTVQDCRTYHLESFYGIYPTLHKQVFDRKINDLVNHQLLSSISPQQSSIPTSIGIEWLAHVKAQLPLNHYNGLALHKTDQLFYARLLLIIQILTNKKMNESSYIPIIEDQSVYRWIKEDYLKSKPHVREHLQLIYNELRLLLNEENEQYANLFVDRITAYQHYGMSLEQLALTYKINIHDVPLMITAIVHHMIIRIKSNKRQFPFMSQLLKDLSTDGTISQSAMQTYELIKKQYSINDIAYQRRLKRSTIYDHIVEIALYDLDFSIRPFVSYAKQHEIINAVKQKKTFKLKTIKENISEEISYFQIRLTLAQANLRLE